jgi:hypothetical protein
LYVWDTTRTDEEQLTIELTNLSAEDEAKLTLRKFITHKINTNLIHENGNLGIVPTYVANNKISKTTTCYYSEVEAVFPDKSVQRCILCLLSAIDTDALHIFRMDLMKFSRKVRDLVVRRASKPEIQAYLNNWYSVCIEYPREGLKILLNELDTAIHAALIGKSFVLKPHPDNEHVTRLLESLSLTGSLEFIEDENQKYDTDLERVMVDLTSKVHLSTRETNEFCREWADNLREISREVADPFKIRALIEQRKLSIIQDMNEIKKSVEMARMDHYGMYKAFQQLKKNHNKDVTLVALLREAGDDNETREVLEVIYNYLIETEVIPGARH